MTEKIPSARSKIETESHDDALQKKPFLPEGIASEMQQSDARSALRMLLETVPRTSEIPEGVVMMIMTRASTASEAREVLQVLKETYSFTATSGTIGAILDKADSLATASHIVDELCNEFAISPDEIILIKLIQQTEDSAQSRALVADFRKQYPEVKLTSRTLNTVLNKVRALKNAGETISALADEIGVVPDAGTLRTTLFRILGIARPDGDALRDVRTIISTLDSIGARVFPNDRGKKDSYVRILYARYLFLERRQAEAIELLAPFLQNTDVDERTKKLVLPMLWAFLPENHPLRVAVASSLREQGQDKLITETEGREGAFNAIFDEWLGEARIESKKKYGGGTVFDDLHTRPIDKQTFRTVVPKRDEEK